MEDDENLLDDPYEQKQIVPSKVSLVYSWGKNQDGQLGISTSKNTQIPTPPKGFKGLIQQVVAARSHTVLLTKDGKMYLTGSLQFGKMGFQAPVNNFRYFHLLKEMNKYQISKVACGDFHTIAMTDTGILFSCGGTLFDKTGHKAGGIHKIQRLTDRNIVNIACGDFHSVAITKDGEIYSWGGGGQHKNKGQLGHSNRNDLPHPEKIQFFKNKKIIKIACGHYHTMVMTNQYDLFAFGEGLFGQLGTGKKQDTSTPRKVLLNLELNLEEIFTSEITEKTRIQHMALGGKHSLLLTNKGHVYVCGYGSQGQLGLSHGFTQNRHEPTLVKALLGKQIVMVAAGSNHSLALSSRHDVYSCGYNAKKQLGIQGDRSVTNWTHITSLAKKKVGKIFAGGDQSWAVIDQLQPWIQNYQPPSPIKINEDITMIKQDNSLRQDNSIRPDRSMVIDSNSMDEILVELNSNRKLELIISQVQLSHRFVHFVIKRSCKNYRKKIEEYIKYIYQNEKNQMKYHKINQDNDLFDQKGQILLPANSNGCTIMLVCQISSEANEYINYSNPKNTIAIGQLILMNSKMLKINGKIPIHNRWFFKFNDMFDDIIEKSRFIQLRPSRI